MMTFYRYSYQCDNRTRIASELYVAITAIAAEIRLNRRCWWPFNEKKNLILIHATELESSLLFSGRFSIGFHSFFVRSLRRLFLIYQTLLMLVLFSICECHVGFNEGHIKRTTTIRQSVLLSRFAVANIEHKKREKNGTKCEKKKAEAIDGEPALDYNNYN